MPYVVVASEIPNALKLDEMVHCVCQDEDIAVMVADEWRAMGRDYVHVIDLSSGKFIYTPGTVHHGDTMAQRLANRD